MEKASRSFDGTCSNGGRNYTVEELRLREKEDPIVTLFGEKEPHKMIIFPIVIEICEGLHKDKCFHVCIPHDLPRNVAFKIVQVNVPDINQYRLDVTLSGPYYPS